MNDHNNDYYSVSWDFGIKKKIKSYAHRWSFIYTHALYLLI